MTNTADVLRTAYASLELNELLQQKTSILLGVTAEAEQVLKYLGIENVFDLGTSSIFADARSAVDAYKLGSLTADLGILPSDLLKPGSSYSSLEEIGEMSVDNLRGIDANRVLRDFRQIRGRHLLRWSLI